jgi:hypothetical protein
MDRNWLRRWKCFHFHNHVLRMDSGAWGGIECTRSDCGERFSANEYRRFTENQG